LRVFVSVCRKYININNTFELLPLFFQFSSVKGHVSFSQTLKMPPRPHMSPPRARWAEAPHSPAPNLTPPQPPPVVGPCPCIVGGGDLTSPCTRGCSVWDGESSGGAPCPWTFLVAVLLPRVYGCAVALLLGGGAMHVAGWRHLLSSDLAPLGTSRSRQAGHFIMQHCFLEMGS
jgi:hypothetical protein